MPDIHISLSEKEMARVRAAAESAGMTVDEFVTKAATVELHARYVLPKKAGVILPFQALKRTR